MLIPFGQGRGPLLFSARDILEQQILRVWLDIGAGLCHLLVRQLISLLNHIEVVSLTLVLMYNRRLWFVENLFVQGVVPLKTYHLVLVRKHVYSILVVGYLLIGVVNQVFMGAFVVLAPTWIHWCLAFITFHLLVYQILNLLTWVSQGRDAILIYAALYFTMPRHSHDVLSGRLGLFTVVLNRFLTPYRVLVDFKGVKCSFLMINCRMLELLRFLNGVRALSEGVRLSQLLKFVYEIIYVLETWPIRFRRLLIYSIWLLRLV